MPFEVYPVRAPIDSTANSLKSMRAARTENKVADEIAKIYNSVAANSGRIIARHKLETYHYDEGTHGHQTLFLVAEFPPNDGQGTDQ